ncbi:MAG: nitrous oxide reductase family maturation protein NosD [Halobacteriales archaeon]
MSRDTDSQWHRIDRRMTLKGIAATIGIAGLSGQAAGTPGGGASNCDLVVDDDDPSNYDSIQAAVDAANSGETICVAPGTYEEHVVINKAELTVKKLDLPSTTPDPVVEAPDGEPYAIEIVADDVTVKDFIVQGATDGDAEGLTAQNTSGVHLEDLLIRDNADRGLTVGHSVNATLKNITAKDNGNDGLTVWQSHNCTVVGCTAHDNGDNGIYTNGNNNTVKDSTAYDNDDQGIDMSNDHDVVGGTDEEWGGATVENCESFDNDNGGIELHDDEGIATVKDNHTYDNDIASNINASGLVLNLEEDTYSVEVVTGNNFEDGIAVDGVDTDP